MAGLRTGFLSEWFSFMCVRVCVCLFRVFIFKVKVGVLKVR